MVLFNIDLLKFVSVEQSTFSCKGVVMLREKLILVCPLVMMTGLFVFTCKVPVKWSNYTVYRWQGYCSTVKVIAFCNWIPIVNVDKSSPALVAARFWPVSFDSFVCFTAFRLPSLLQQIQYTIHGQIPWDPSLGNILQELC